MATTTLRLRGSPELSAPAASAAIGGGCSFPSHTAISESGSGSSNDSGASRFCRPKRAPTSSALNARPTAMSASISMRDSRNPGIANQSAAVREEGPPGLVFVDLPRVCVDQCGQEENFAVTKYFRNRMWLWWLANSHNSSYRATSRGESCEGPHSCKSVL